LPEPITRRQFLRDSAFLAGAAVVFDPSWLFAAGTDSRSTAAGHGDPSDRSRHSGADGVFAEVEYGDGDGAPLVRWTRLGEDHSLELWHEAVVVDVPLLSETTAAISLADFDQGRGHHEVVHYFGAPTLAQLRTEVAYSRILIRQPREQAA